jgi:hypothetical protein
MLRCTLLEDGCSVCSAEIRTDCPPLRSVCGCFYEVTAMYAGVATEILLRIHIQRFIFVHGTQNIRKPRHLHFCSNKYSFSPAVSVRTRTVHFHLWWISFHFSTRAYVTHLEYRVYILQPWLRCFTICLIPWHYGTLIQSTPIPSYLPACSQFTLHNWPTPWSRVLLEKLSPI